jgi:hypothetical protein
MTDRKCVDCTLPLLGVCQGETGFQDLYDAKGNVAKKDWPDPPHKDTCCDCYDEGHGMKPAKRTRPRPEPATI